MLVSADTLTADNITFKSLSPNVEVNFICYFNAGKRWLLRYWAARGHKLAVSHKDTVDNQ